MMLSSSTSMLSLTKDEDHHHHHSSHRNSVFKWSNVTHGFKKLKLKRWNSTGSWVVIITIFYV